MKTKLEQRKILCFNIAQIAFIVAACLALAALCVQCSPLEVTP